MADRKTPMMKMDPAPTSIQAESHPGIMKSMLNSIAAAASGMTDMKPSRPLDANPRAGDTSPARDLVGAGVEATKSKARKNPLTQADGYEK